MKKTITLITLLLLSLVGYSQTNEPTKTSVRNTDSQKIVRVGDSLKLDNSPGIDLSDLKGSTLKKTSRDSIANLTQAQLIALGTRFVTDTVADVVSGGGTVVNSAIPLGFVSPRAYGAVMDGVTDDRDAFVAALAANPNIWMGDDVMFIDVETPFSKSIFLPDNTYILGNVNAQIIYNNDISPAFISGQTDNIKFENIELIYDQIYDASYDWSVNNDHTANQLYIKNYLETNKNMDYVVGNPIFRGPPSFQSTFMLHGTNGFYLHNVKFIAKGTTANTFVKFAIKFIEQHLPNDLNINEITSPTEPVKNVEILDVVMDGVLMGMQGCVENLTINRLDSYRHSDLQNADGSNAGGSIGGGIYRFPPPHLIYLNTDNSINGFYPKNIKIYNVIDHGIWVGVARRDEESGYCGSLKLVGKIVNAHVDNYKSFRPDGLGDFGDTQDSRFENIYAEGDTSLFDSSSSFSSMRHLGPHENTIFKNIDIVDLAENPEIWALDYASGNGNTFDSVNLFLNNIPNSTTGPYGFSGNNNTIKNSTLYTKSHTNTSTFNPIIFQDNSARANNSNNNFEVNVVGWRSITTDAGGLKPRMLFADKNNPNNNYAKVFDANNNLTIEQVNEIETSTWTQTFLVDLATLNVTGTSYQLPRTIQSGWNIKSISTVLNTALASGITASVTNGVTPVLIADIGTAVNSIRVSNFDEITPADSRIYLRTTVGSFNATGVVKVTVTLVRRILNN